MNALDWLPVLTLGSLLGAVGQVIRTIPGLKKLNEDPNGRFKPAQLLISIVIGAAAGVLAMITLELTSSQAISTQDIVTVIAAGYTGADFIEAFISKNVAGVDRTIPPKAGDAPPTMPSSVPTPMTLIGTIPPVEKPVG